MTNMQNDILPPAYPDGNNNDNNGENMFDVHTAKLQNRFRNNFHKSLDNIYKKLLKQGDNLRFITTQNTCTVSFTYEPVFRKLYLLRYYNQQIARDSNNIAQVLGININQYALNYLHRKYPKSTCITSIRISENEVAASISPMYHINITITKNN